MRAIELVAKRLGNTKTVCRKCYIHPAVIEAYLAGSLVHTLRQGAERELTQSLHKLKPEEAAVLAFLQHLEPQFSLKVAGTSFAYLHEDESE